MFLSVPKAIGSLDHVLEKTSCYLKIHKVESESAFVVTLAVDEIFSNFVKYQSSGTLNIEIEIHVRNGRVTTTMRDFDVEEFDFTKSEPANMQSLAEKASPGGRGLYFIKQLTDKIEYSYTDRICTVVITKLLRNPHV